MSPATFDRDDIMRKLQRPRRNRARALFDDRRGPLFANVQPCSPTLNDGGFAVAHNGNLSNA
jgi:glutamine phosphoribosylpyrophosphate amidotransferase